MSKFSTHFSCLDELIQVIYQGIHKFVVMSTVTDDSKWHIYIGLQGPQGRWWHGFWTEKDIHLILGSKLSEKLLEPFAEKLAEAFIEGDLCMSNWSADKGADIKFTLRPSTKPMHLPLVEMSPEEAAAHATSVFIGIALQAQSRKCQMYPSMDYSPVPLVSSSLKNTQSAVPSSSKRKEMSPEPQHRKAGTEQTSSKISLEAEEEIKSLKSQLESEKRKADRSAPNPVVAAPVARTHKGASLANPNKKARRYKPIEFDSDDE